MMIVKNYTVEDYKRMLINVLDAHYGGAIHHIGDGDGIPETEAEEIRQFWAEHIEQMVRAYAGLRDANQ